MAQGKTKIAAIKMGHDWFDAEVDHVVIPAGMNLREQRDAYRKWYSEVYVASGKLISGTNFRHSQTVKYRSFAEWLVDETEAREATSEDVEEIWP